MTREISRRAFLQRTAPLGAAVIGGPVLLSSCGDDDGTSEGGSLLERAREQGFIRVGFANEAPYGFADEKIGRAHV